MPPTASTYINIRKNKILKNCVKNSTRAARKKVEGRSKNLALEKTQKNCKKLKQAKKIVKTFFTTKFEGGRHQRRVKKLGKL